MTDLLPAREVAQLRAERDAWEKGVRDANAISQRERERAERAEAALREAGNRARRALAGPRDMFEEAMRDPALARAVVDALLSDLSGEMDRAERYRLRLARVLRLVKEDRDWAGIPGGGVWSSRALAAPQQKETP